LLRTCFIPSCLGNPLSKGKAVFPLFEFVQYASRWENPDWMILVRCGVGLIDEPFRSSEPSKLAAWLSEIQTKRLGLWNCSLANVFRTVDRKINRYHRHLVSMKLLLVVLEKKANLFKKTSLSIHLA